MQDVETGPSQMTEYVDLLQDLGIPKIELQTTVLKAYRSRFTKILTTQQQTEEQQLKARLKSATPEAEYSAYMEASIARLDEAFLKDFEAAVAVYSAVFLEANCKYWLVEYC